MVLSGLSNDELLDIPEANLLPGELTRVFSAMQYLNMEPLKEQKKEAQRKLGDAA